MAPMTMRQNRCKQRSFHMAPQDAVLSLSDVQAIADAVTLQMLSLPREIEAVVRPHFTFNTSLDPMTKDGRHNLMLRIQTDRDGMWLEFTMNGQQRLAMLRFNYRGWAWTQ